LRSRPDICAAAPATSLAGARGLRFPEKPRTRCHSVIHRLSRPLTADLHELATDFPHVLLNSPISAINRPEPGFGRDARPPDLAPLGRREAMAAAAAAGQPPMSPLSHRREAEETQP